MLVDPFFLVVHRLRFLQEISLDLQNSFVRWDVPIIGDQVAVDHSLRSVLFGIRRVHRSPLRQDNPIINVR